MSKERAYGSGMSQEKATRLLVLGIVLAVGFGTLVMISNSLTANASAWYDYEHAINQQNLNKGVIGSEEYNARETELTLTQTWMLEQQIYLGNIGRIGMNIGLICVFVGFIGFGTNTQMDENTRRACIIIAGVVLFVLIISFVGGLAVSIF